MRDEIIKFIEELKYEKKYSELTINGYLNDLDYFEQNPSAERIAKYIYEQIIQLLAQENIDIAYKNQTDDAFLYAIDVFETDTSRARYIPFV